jgi:hypothetical protein
MYDTSSSPFLFDHHHHHHHQRPEPQSSVYTTLTSKDYPEPVGPFQGTNAVEQFHNTCMIEISNEAPIVFTYNDLLAPNIIISPGRNPKVAAIIDWGPGWLVPCLLGILQGAVDKSESELLRRCLPRRLARELSADDS